MKLHQLDFRNVDDELITPDEWYSELRQGTLVMVRATLHAFNWDNRRVCMLHSLMTVMSLRCIPFVPKGLPAQCPHGAGFASLRPGCRAVQAYHPGPQCPQEAGDLRGCSIHFASATRKALCSRLKKPCTHPMPEYMAVHRHTFLRISTQPTIFSRICLQYSYDMLPRVSLGLPAVPSP